MDTKIKWKAVIWTGSYPSGYVVFVASGELELEQIARDSGLQDWVAVRDLLEWLE